MVKIASVVGARPNFIKLAPIYKALSDTFEHTIIHTGQHYDYKLSEIFFKEFNLPEPDHNLEIGSGLPGFQVGQMIQSLEKIFFHSKFNLVIVYGDTNSTLAGALSAVQSNILLVHVESGLRSFDRRMPEEINRRLTDNLAQYLYAPTQAAVKNLRVENVSGKVVYSGDVAVEIVKYAENLSSGSAILDKLGIESGKYVLFTMHRAENTQSRDALVSIIKAFEVLSDITVVFPIHPRTARILGELGLYSRLQSLKNVKLVEPTGYVDFISLLRNSKTLVTDSGGAQKEAYLLKIPCITIRENTEWVETVESGWNILTGLDTIKIVRAVREWNPKSADTPSIFGDGNASQIIKKSIKSILL